jgi:hypothetical protein
MLAQGAAFGAVLRQPAIEFSAPRGIEVLLLFADALDIDRSASCPWSMRLTIHVTRRIGGLVSAAAAPVFPGQTQSS